MGDPYKSKKDFHSLNGKANPFKEKESSSKTVYPLLGLVVAAIAAYAIFINPVGFSEVEVEGTVQAQVTAAAEEAVQSTATTLSMTCFITPLAQYSSVGVRKTPEVTDDNLIRGLYQGDQMKVAGHNGRTLNVDRWWLVELGEGDDVTYAWVHSSVVEEITDQSCALVEQVPGS